MSGHRLHHFRMSEEIITENIGGTSGRNEMFEALLRRFLPFLPADEPLAEDAPLRDLGLDSMGVVELLAALESTFDVRFRDDALSLENFASPGRLRHTLDRMRELPA
jgi:acyl carrier protein